MNFPIQKIDFTPRNLAEYVALNTQHIYWQCLADGLSMTLSEVENAYLVHAARFGHDTVEYTMAEQAIEAFRRSKQQPIFTEIDGKIIDVTAKWPELDIWS